MLNSCIHINQERISRRHIIPNGVRFYLNQDYLREIKQAQAQRLNIELSPELLADFRYYVLIERQRYIPSDITFSTYYQQDTHEIAKIQSTISVEGKIQQQICHNDWTNAQLLRKIVNAHYWLIGQMLNQLPMEKKAYTKQLPWYIALVITILLAPLLLYLVNSGIVIDLFAVFLLLLLMHQLSKKFLINYLRQYILFQLLFGFFSRRSQHRKLGFALLAIFS